LLLVFLLIERESKGRELGRAFDGAFEEDASRVAGARTDRQLARTDLRVDALHELNDKVNLYDSRDILGLE
jgi:hypothetical protein